MSGVRGDVEICASVYNVETVPYAIYERQGGLYRKIEQKTERIEYFGGSDACQGDSGGPM